MTGKLLTTTRELESRLAAAQARERAARARAAQLRRQVARVGRRAEAHRLCVLGAALVAWCDRDERVLAATRRFLGEYVTRTADRDVLRGTAFELSVPTAEGGTHGNP